jgi:glycosyltransferase involved in cell wall biosynthesis
MSEIIFSVIIATWNRGRHILPSVYSVLDQKFSAFELIIVGDQCDDDETAQALAPLLSERVIWTNLGSHCGSQATPNNVGIALARGDFVAYLGHDDLWTPGHLLNFYRCFDATGCDVAVAGCAYHGPPGTDLVIITGLFNDAAAAKSHFFPPSSFAHRRQLPDGAPQWRRPEAIAAPVDCDFLLRAVEAGARFASTGTISAHKFAAGHRYLSYLAPASREQSAFLDFIRQGAINESYELALIERAKAANTFMIIQYPNFSSFQPGQLYHANRLNKGIDRAMPTLLTGAIHVLVSDEPRALDWYGVEIDAVGETPYRWSGPSLRPKILIPFTGDKMVRITFHIIDSDPANVIESLRILFNKVEVTHRLQRQLPGWIDVVFDAALKPRQSSIAELIVQNYFCPAEVGVNADSRKLGVKLGGFTIASLA